MKVINKNDCGWQLENGLWYDNGCVAAFGICPKCGDTGQIYHIGRREYGACEKCMVRWDIGENLFSGWRYMTEDEFEKNRQLLSKMEDARALYTANPLTVKDKKMLEEMLETINKNDNAKNISSENVNLPINEDQQRDDIESW